MTDIDDFVWEDLDDDRARTDPEFRAASAEWLVSYKALSLAQEQRLNDDLYSNLLKLRDMEKELVALGVVESIPKVHRATAKIRKMLDKDVSNRGHAYYAVDDLVDDFRRVEFGCVAWRYRFDHWPTLDDLVEFLLDEWDWQVAKQAIAESLNERSRRKAGLFVAPEDWLVEAMQFPLPLALQAKSARPTTRLDSPGVIDLTNDRCFVSAEAQVRHRLHEIYRRYAYQPLAESNAA